MPVGHASPATALPAGRLRHEIKLFHPVRVQDASGQSITTGYHYATVKAAIQPLGGNELLLANQAQSGVTLRVLIRYRSDIEPTHWIERNGRRCDIISIANVDERNVSMELHCKEWVAVT
jgi:SPP1 family predicted phage head-tail adaptor